MGDVWRIRQRVMAGLWRGLTSPYMLLGVTLASLGVAVLSGLWFHGSAGESGGEIAAVARPGSLLARTAWLAELYASWNWLAALDSWLGRSLLALIALVALWQLLNAWFASWSAPSGRLADPYRLALPCDAAAASRRLEQAFALGGAGLSVCGGRPSLTKPAKSKAALLSCGR